MKLMLKLHKTISKIFMKLSKMFELYRNIGLEYANGTKTNGGQKGHKKIPGS